MKKDILLDTNILVEIFRGSRAPDLKLGLARKLTAKYTPYICLQNLAEFWTVATRPLNVNGLGLTAADASYYVKAFSNSFGMVLETRQTVSLWQDICEKNEIKGRRVHDMRLAAIAISSGISLLATYNTADFSCVTGLELLQP